MALIDIPLYILTLFEFIMFILGMGECVISNTKENHGIFFGVIATPSSPHQQFMYDTWIKNLSVISPSSKVAFVSAPGKEIQDVLYLHPDPNKRALRNKVTPPGKPRDIDITLGRLTGAAYFLQSTKLEWYWSTSDDCLINPHKIQHILDDLNSRHNTYAETHIEGHCITDSCLTYMQGGSGYIFSRKAAKLFLKEGYSYLKTMKYIDDMDFSRMLKQSSVIT